MHLTFFPFFVSLCLYQYMQSDSLFSGIFYTFLQKVPQNFNQASCFKFHQSLAGVYVISLVSAGFGACIG